MNHPHFFPLLLAAFGVGPMNSWPPVFDIYASGILPAKDIELLSIAVDASFIHRCAPARAVRHIKRALKAGVTVKEIFEVLKLCFSQGVQACNLGADCQRKVGVRIRPTQGVSLDGVAGI